MNSMDQTSIQSIINEPLFTPRYLNFDYIFSQIYDFLLPVWIFITNPHTWSIIGLISNIFSLIFLFIIIFSLVRLFEIQIYDIYEVNEKINKALARRKEIERSANPRWHYIETLIESPNDSDWRVAVIEADTMLEEILTEKGLSGSTVSELLEGAKESGYLNIQNVWDAHLIRNQIAHEGSDFSLSQVEGRRVINLYKSFFEEIKAI